MPQPNFNAVFDVLIFLMAAVLIVTLFRKLRLSPVLGYLMAGLIIGPYSVGLVSTHEETLMLAELGIVFLLFTIGLELSLDRLKAMRKYVFGLGMSQVLVTSAAMCLVAFLIGQKLSSAIVIGGALALSSTAIVIQLLVERGDFSSRLGRIVFAILLFQDLAVVPLLAVIPLLGDTTGSLTHVLLMAGLKAVIALVVIMVAGRILLRPALRVVASMHSPELFTATVLLVALGIGYLTHHVGLSMALGAFLAGVLLSESEYRHQVEADIEPFRGLLLGLFFTSVGMQIDVRQVVQEWDTLLLFVVVLMILKASILYLICRSMMLPRMLSAKVGIMLSQGGEFAFVVLGLAIGSKVIDLPTGQFLFLGVAATMALTPIVMMVMNRVLDHKINQTISVDQKLSQIIEDTHDVADHVIIAGFGRVGYTIARLLEQQRIPFVALDMDPQTVSAARSKGLPVYYGDARRTDVLRAVGAIRARGAVITLDQARTTARVLTTLHHAFPNMPIFVRARDTRHARELAALGAVTCVPETLESSLQLGAAVLRLTGFSGEDTENIIATFRNEEIGAPAHETLQLPQKGQSTDS